MSQERVLYYHKIRLSPHYQWSRSLYHDYNSLFNEAWLEVIPTGIRGISQNRGKYWASVIPPTQTAYFHLNSLLCMQIA